MFALFCIAVLATGGLLSACVIRFTRKHGLT
jgi:hypothetical protein